jgi:hypothetical protein
MAITASPIERREEDHLLYRAAELTMEKVYDGFLLVERDTERDVETRVDSYGPGPFPTGGRPGASTGRGSAGPTGIPISAIRSGTTR